MLPSLTAGAQPKADFCWRFSRRLDLWITSKSKQKSTFHYEILRIGIKYTALSCQILTLEFLEFSSITPEKLKASNSGMGKVDVPINSSRHGRVVCYHGINNKRRRADHAASQCNRQV